MLQRGHSLMTATNDKRNELTLNLPLLKEGMLYVYVLKYGCMFADVSLYDHSNH